MKLGENPNLAGRARSSAGRHPWLSQIPGPRSSVVGFASRSLSGLKARYDQRRSTDLNPCPSESSPPSNSQAPLSRYQGAAYARLADGSSLQPPFLFYCFPDTFCATRPAFVFYLRFLFPTLLHRCGIHSSQLAAPSIPSRDEAAQTPIQPSVRAHTTSLQTPQRRAVDRLELW